MYSNLLSKENELVNESIQKFNSCEQSLDWANEVKEFCNKHNETIKMLYNSLENDKGELRQLRETTYKTRDALFALQHKAEVFINKYNCEQERKRTQEEKIKWIKEQEAKRKVYEEQKHLYELAEKVAEEERLSDEKEREEEMFNKKMEEKARRKVEEWKKGRDGDLYYHLDKEKERMERLHYLTKANHEIVRKHQDEHQINTDEILSLSEEIESLKEDDRRYVTVHEDFFKLVEMAKRLKDI